MIDKNTICQTIRGLYPDIGDCGIDLQVDYDKKNSAWVVELQRDGRKLKTYLENTDTDSCLLKENCIGLGIEIAQLQSNIDRLTA
jgi:hypothetical protein